MEPGVHSVGYWVSQRAPMKGVAAGECAAAGGRRGGKHLPPLPPAAGMRCTVLKLRRAAPGLLRPPPYRPTPGLRRPLACFLLARDIRSIVLRVVMLVRSRPPAAWMRCTVVKLPLKLEVAAGRRWPHAAGAWGGGGGAGQREGVGWGVAEMLELATKVGGIGAQNSCGCAHASGRAQPARRRRRHAGFAGGRRRAACAPQCQQRREPTKKRPLRRRRAWRRKAAPLFSAQKQKQSLAGPPG